MRRDGTETRKISNERSREIGASDKSSRETRRDVR